MGLAAGLYAILSALVQKDLKRLLALSTVENMGIAVIGLGAGLTALHAGLPTAAFLGLAGALLHVLGHSLFKGLLFLAAGSVLKGAGTAMLDRLGGLAKRMPATSFCFAAGSAAIAGLPPFNGFVGEFAIYLSLASGLTDGSGRAAMILGFAGLAAVGGLAMACFTRALGLAFLGAPRGPVVDNATESGPGMLLPMALLAVLCLAGGLGAPYFFSLAAPTAQAMLHGLGAPGVEPEALAGAMDTMTHIGLAGLALAILVPALALARRALPAAQRERPLSAPGTAVMPNPRSACSIRRTPSRIPWLGCSARPPGSRAHLDPPQGLFPGKALLETRTPDLAREYFWTPVFEWTRRACDTLKWFQHGRLHIYILCLLATLVALLAWQLGGDVTMEALLRMLPALVLAPLLLGVINRVKALFGGRTGRPLLQTYFDLAKLMRKGVVISPTTTWAFRAGPILAVARVRVRPGAHPPGRSARGLLLSPAISCSWPTCLALRAWPPCWRPWTRAPASRAWGPVARPPSGPWPSPCSS